MAVMPSSARPRALRQLQIDPVWITFVVLLLIWVFSLIRVEGYRSLDFNLFTLRVAAFLGIVAAGQTLVVLMGGIDLSVAAVVTMTGVIGGHLITQIGEAAGIVLTLLIAALVGVVNGLGVVALRLPPLVMTLASLSVIQGVLLVYNAGKPVSGESEFLSYWALGTLLGWLEQNVGKDLSLPAIARRAGMSTRTLSRRFRQQVGTTPALWVSRARVRRAQRLLETTDLSVESVADGVGFGSATVLRDRFRRIVGTSPQSYRRSFRVV